MPRPLVCIITHKHPHDRDSHFVARILLRNSSSSIKAQSICRYLSGYRNSITSTMNSHRLALFQLATFLLLLPFVLCQGDVNDYGNLGRGSCTDTRGQFYSYIQRTEKFPDASTCASAECAKYSNAESYRGFEFSVSKRCTCLFDADRMPPVDNSAENPEYLSKTYNGQGGVAGTSGTPGAWCYRFGKNSANMGSTAGFFVATIMATTFLFVV